MDRNGLMKHVGDWIQRLGSQAKVAEKCGINGGALSTWLRGNYGADTAKLEQTIAKALDYKANSWVTVETIANYRQIKMVFDNAKSESMWFAISNKAGSGKTETLQDLFNRDKSGTIVFMQAEEWTARQFLTKLIEKTSGAIKGYHTISQLTDMAVSYFNGFSLQRPVLIIDEADKLKPSALRTLIPIYNRTEHRLGAVLAGTDNLEKEIKKGVDLKRKGFDELDSRLGRSFIHLKGASEADVKAICAANGIEDDEKQMYVWSQLEKVKKQVKVRTTKGGERDMMVEFVEDFRRLMRLIKTEHITQRLKAA
jgi:DNA transposition AAA+ family ATPase